MSVELLKFAAMCSQILLYAGIFHQIKLNFDLKSTAAVSPTRWILRAIPNAILALYGIGQMQLDLFLVGNTGAVAALCCFVLAQILLLPPRRSAALRLGILGTLLLVIWAGVLVVQQNAWVVQPSRFLNASPLVAILLFIVPGQIQQVWLNRRLDSLNGLSLLENGMTALNYVIWGAYLILRDGTTAAIGCGIGAVFSLLICAQIFGRVPQRPCLNG